MFVNSMINNEYINNTFQTALGYYQAGNLLKAESSCREILEIQPGNADILHFLGIIYYQLGNNDSAIAHIKKALILNPAIPDAYYNLGVIFHDKKQLDEAITYYQKSLDLNPNHVDAYCNLGVALSTFDRIDEALTVFDKALQLNPAHLLSLWARCMSQLFIIYPDQKSIHISRHRYQDDLIKIKELISLGISSKDLETLVDAISKLAPFYLAYQGFNDDSVRSILQI